MFVNRLSGNALEVGDLTDCQPFSDVVVDPLLGGWQSGVRHQWVTLVTRFSVVNNPNIVYVWLSTYP